MCCIIFIQYLEVQDTDYMLHLYENVQSTQCQWLQRGNQSTFLHPVLLEEN